jgi:hypothetical protein
VKKYSENIPKMIFQGNEQTIENVHHTRDRIFDMPTEDEINSACNESNVYEKTYKLQF